MKISSLIAAVFCLLSLQASAHERITIGPRGGRILFVDSTATPNIEFKVNAEGRAEISLLDKNRRIIPLQGQTLTLTAGPRESAKKLALTREGDLLISDKLPDGAPYTVVLQLKEAPANKALTLRVRYDSAPAKSGKPVYLDDSVNAGSGPSIKVPDSLEGLFAEVNQHHGELQDGFKERKFEALDEVLQAFTVLLEALKARASQSNNAAAVETNVTALLKSLGAIAAANDARTLESEGGEIEAVKLGIGRLKQAYPEKVANAKL
jgi:hypothetical protein